MEVTTHQTGRERTIDVSGLAEETVRAVELLVSQLRSAQQQQPKPKQAGRFGSYASYEEWSKALREWVESHPKRTTLADDSREAIYSDDLDE